MNSQTAACLAIYGFFLLLLGVSGYFTNPEKAGTALISGGSFGALSILWGILGAKGIRWSKPAALLTSSLLGAACVWRGSLGWLAVANGQPQKALPALLITLMLAVAVASVLCLLKDRKPGVESPAGQPR